MFEANKILQNELDELAGTEDISLLVELINNQSNIMKVFAVRKFLSGLKSLKISVDNYVANKVIDAISKDLTSEVMDWYDKIKTTGDPDVHFSGFDVERTKTGKVKARKVAIKAESYGKQLVSAVSSLSESKLNALGLCVSIARNLKADSPFSFLIIDDPIQSWDAEHETQFIELIQMLIDRGKQVLLMSHNKRWIEMVRAGCRSMSGRYYEFTGYTMEGPNIEEMPWILWRNRLDDIDATLKDTSATTIKLQHAEEDIRIVCSEISCEIYYKKTGKKKSAHDVNSKKVRKMLIESGINSGLVDRITMTYETTDDAHHAPLDYEAEKKELESTIHGHMSSQAKYSYRSMHKPPTVYIDTNVLKFSATKLFRLHPRQKVIKWGDITEEVTVHDPVHINPNDKISDSVLKRETELLESVAESAKNGSINIVINVETEFESWGIPNMDSESGRFFGAPVEMIESPINHSRVLMGVGFDTETLQMNFLTSIEHPRFKELIKLTRAYQGKHGYNKNQLLDAFHLWCAEGQGCEFFLTLDFKLIRIVKNNTKITINTELVMPSDLLSLLNARA